jgi:cytoplasmic iron level regulating protein YaaA (DUF328/UPF0246 family)
MSSFIALLSPAKLLDDQTHYPDLSCTDALFTEQSKALVSKLKRYSSEQLADLMEMSTALGDETRARFHAWKLPFTHENAHPAILMFKGEVYRGLQAIELSKKQLDYAQKHFRILSGLYGAMRPLDLVMPYRLMMGTRFKISTKTPDLYAFWSNHVTQHLVDSLGKNDCLLNLSSAEYFKCVNTDILNRRVIQCEFKEKKGAQYKTVNTYTKLARGKMARFIIEHQLKNVDDIRSFDQDRYIFNTALSTSDQYVFTR